MAKRSSKRTFRQRVARFFRLLFIALIFTFIILYGWFVIQYSESLLEPNNGSIGSTTPADWNLEYEAVSIESDDGISMAGWYIPPQSVDTRPAIPTAAVILLHGDGADRLSLSDQAQWLAGAGFGVLMVDLPGHGESIADHRSFGWEDIDNVDAAVTWLGERNISRVGIYGFSMGGHVALRTAAQNRSIQAIWVDGASPVRAGDLLPLQADPLYIANYFTIFFVDRYMAYRLDDSFLPDEASENMLDEIVLDMPDLVKEILPDVSPRPIQFVAAENGLELPIAETYLDRAGNNADLWVIDGASHGTTWVDEPEAYETRLVTFFNQHLNFVPSAPSAPPPSDAMPSTAPSTTETPTPTAE